jgi:dipeptidyl aminopeptidase/acylaminoacyl peptidase
LRVQRTLQLDLGPWPSRDGVRVIRPALSPDCDLIAAFAADADNLGLMVLDIRNPRAATGVLIHDRRLPQAPTSSPIWTRDGSAVHVGNDLTLMAHNFGSRWRIEEVDVAAAVLDVFPDASLLVPSDRSSRQLWRAPVDGRDAVRIVDHPAGITGGLVSPSGCCVAYAANDTSDVRNLDVYVVDRRVDESSRVFCGDEASTAFPRRWLDDGTLIVDAEIEGWRCPVLVDVAAGETIQLLGEPGVDSWFADSGPADCEFALLEFVDGALRPVLWFAGEKSLLRLAPDGADVGWIRCLGDRGFVGTLSDPVTPPSLHVVSVTDARDTIQRSQGSRPRKLGHVSARCPVPALEFEGEGRRAIIGLHGGPAAHWSLRYEPLVRWGSDRGYHILLPNVRGSSGYGRSHRLAAAGAWGGPDLEDVKLAANYLRTRGLQPERISIVGQSYGAYLGLLAACTVMVACERVVCWAPIADLETLAQSSPRLQQYLRFHLGRRAFDSQQLRLRSPVSYLSNLRAPLLLIHGEDDEVIPMSQAEQLAKALQELNKPFSWQSIPGLGHFTDEPCREQEVWDSIFAFLDDLHPEPVGGTRTDRTRE